MDASVVCLVAIELKGISEKSGVKWVEWSGMSDKVGYSNDEEDKDKRKKKKEKIDTEVGRGIMKGVRRREIKKRRKKSNRQRKKMWPIRF